MEIALRFLRYSAKFYSMEINLYSTRAPIQVKKNREIFTFRGNKLSRMKSDETFRGNKLSRWTTFKRFYENKKKAKF